MIRMARFEGHARVSRPGRHLAGKDFGDDTGWNSSDRAAYWTHNLMGNTERETRRLTVLSVRRVSDPSQGKQST